MSEATAGTAAGPATSHPLTLEQRMGLSRDKIRRWRLTHSWRIRGPLDADRLRAALALVVERHDPLRMRLVRTPDGIRQTFAPATAAHPWFGRSTVTPDGLAAAVAEAVGHRLDLFGTGPLRADLLTAAPDDHVLVLTIHHMAWDAWSAGVLWRDLWTVYAANAPDLAPLRTGYPRFADAQAAHGTVPTPAQLAHWRQVVGESPGPWPAPGSAPPPVRSEDGSGGARLVAARPGPGFPRRLGAFARAARVTAASATTALCLLAVGRALEQPSLLANYQYHGRDREEEWDLVGMFCRRFPVRAALDEGTELGEFARRVQRGLTEGAARSAAPFTLPGLRRLLEDEQPADAPAVAWHPGLSPITVNVVPGRMRGSPAGRTPAPGLTVEPYAAAEPGPEPVARYAGQLWVIATTDPEPVFYADYDRTVVSDTAVQQVSGHLALLTSVADAAAAARRLGDLG
ncbi:condensation domain-containing protein [Streptomyces sp. NBC_00727]|uniref:condensation domain-containing protein n=1 Tax=Streptomyces sp. NBC_00727 TaxID=2903675 RepID=UPI00387036A8